MKNKCQSKFDIKQKYAHMFIYFLFGFICLVIFLPILITLFASFKSLKQIGSDFPLLPPARFHITNYITVFESGKILLGFFNTFFLVAVTLIINVFLNTLVAYCLSRFTFKLKRIIFFLFMVSMIVPLYVTEISRFSIIKGLGLFNTHWAGIVIYSSADMMQLFILLQFMTKIPGSIDESAMIDGCSFFKIYFNMILPLSKAGIATICIIKSIEIINDMYIPYLYMPSTKLHTISTMLMHFSSTRHGSWNNLSAAIIIAMLPTVILYIIFKKNIIKGITSGAVKE